MAGFTRPFSNFRNSQSRFSFNFALQSINVNFFFSLGRRKTRKKLKSFNFIMQKCRKNNFLFSKFGQRLKLLSSCVNPAAPVIINLVATESQVLGFSVFSFTTQKAKVILICSKSLIQS